MKPTEFAKYLTEFLTTYLTGQKNVSKNTILSYRDTFKLLLKYCRSMKRIPPERITMEALTSELVTGFLDWLDVQGEDPSGLYFLKSVMLLLIHRLLLS